MAPNTLVADPNTVQARRETAHDTVAARIGDLLCQAVRAMGEAGLDEEANELAARGWWIARATDPALAGRLNGTMHHLAALSIPPAVIPDGQERRMSTPTDELDVRGQQPGRRHNLILSTYTALPAGDGFVLVNDHDPRPLYHQFAAEYPDRFTWDYLETGPDVWKVRIGRPVSA